MNVEWMVLLQGFRFGHVKARPTQTSLVKRHQECLLIDKTTACNIDQVQPGTGEFERARIDDVAGFLGAGCDQGEVVARRHQSFNAVDLLDTIHPERARLAPRRNDPYAQHKRTPRQSPTDAAETKKSKRAARKRWGFDASPVRPCAHPTLLKAKRMLQ